MPDRIAYIPLNTYPEAPSDAAILAAIGLAETLGCGMHVATFAVDIPPVASPWGGFLNNAEEMARAAEDRSRAECERLRALVEEGAKGNKAIQFAHHQRVKGTALGAATVESRYFDLALLPCSSVSSQDMAQSLVFESGLPVILVPRQRSSRKSSMSPSPGMRTVSRPARSAMHCHSWRTGEG